MNISVRPNFVIFDCDGVLVDSEIPMHRVLTDELNERGVDISFEECIETFVGMSIEGLVEKAKAMGAELHDGWKAELYAKVFDKLHEGVAVIPGVINLIERLEENNIPFCVASNGSEKKMKLMLGQHGLWERFQARCYSAQTLGFAKPDPRLFEYACVQNGFDAQETVVIEDSLVGLTAARNAGLRCLRYQPDLRRHGSDENTVGSFVHMDQISNHIFGISPG